MLKIRVDPRSLQSVGELMADARSARLALRTLREPYERIKEKQIKRWVQNFDGQGRIYGAWPRLSPKWTIPERELMGVGQHILIRGGALFDSFASQNEAGEIEDRGVFWNFRNSQGAFPVRHSEGYTNPIRNRASVPARKLWDLDQHDEDVAVQEHERYINRIITMYFGR